MEKQFNLLIDTKRTGFNTVRGLKQGDNNSVLNITLVQNSIPFDLTDLTIRINYKRPDNKIFLQMADVVNAKEGQIKVNVLTKVLEVDGDVKSDLSVFDKDNRKITSVTFSMFVDASIYRNDYIEPEDLDLIQQIYSEEEKRIRQENEREINEKARQSNENIRIESENVRKDRELERIKNEELRQENENIRVNKEDERITQENERVESETIRQAKEKERVENEETRQANEEKRQSDEITRQQNEENRKQTQLDMQKVITNINEIEPYETSKTYNKLNRVTYNGSSYEAVKDVPINTPPTNTMYWICIAEKGKDGRGSGNMHTDVYDKNNDGIVDVAETANNVDWSNIQNKPDLSQMSKVQSVNDKTGAVVLNAEDIKTNSGESVESQLADMTQQVENIDLSADKVTLDSTVLNSKDVKAGLEELFTFADNGKKNWVDVIGSPLSAEDDFSTLKSKTQTLKNTFASNLSGKGQSASGTENLNSLIGKIGQINTSNIKSIQSGIRPKSEDYVDKKITFKINPVNINNSVIIIQPWSGNSSSCQLTKFVDDSTISLETRNNYQSKYDYYWTVIEFQNIKNMQKGEQISPIGSNSLTIPVKTVNMNKSLVFFTFSAYPSSDTYGVSAFLQTSEKLRIETAQGSFYEVKWCVVEF